MKIYNSDSIQKVNIEFDLYIPISIIFENDNQEKEPLLYYRIGDFEKNLVEIGVDKTSQQICSVTLVICDRIYELSSMDKNFKNFEIGCPSIQICEEQNNTYVDEKGVVEVYFTENEISLMFSNEEIKKCIVNNNIEFLLGVNSNCVGICIKNISKRDMDIFRSAIQY